MISESFDEEQYFLRYPAASCLGISGREHYTRFGKRLGYAEIGTSEHHLGPLDVESSNHPPPIQVEKTDYTLKVADVEYLLQTYDQRLAIDALMHNIISKITNFGRVNHLISLNFAAGGGAERCAFEYAKLSAETAGTVIILLTDWGPRAEFPQLPKNVLLVDFQELGIELTERQRESLLFLILRVTEPEIFQIINSVAAWNLLSRSDRASIPAVRILGTLYAMQYDVNTWSPVGYAASFLPTCFRKLDGIVTDNRRFADECAPTLSLPSEQLKFYVVPNSCRIRNEISKEEAQSRLAARIQRLNISKTLRVLWAGRLDPEKRIDLLADIAKNMGQQADFEVFGRAVVEKSHWEQSLEEIPNINLNGGFTSPLEWDDIDNPTHVFIFTSVWEGMPNALIEASWLGLPIVSADVGGIRDIINQETGWLLPQNASASDYCGALQEIKARPEEALRRTRNLLELVHHRHSEAGFRITLQNALLSKVVVQ